MNIFFFLLNPILTQLNPVQVKVKLYSCLTPRYRGWMVNTTTQPLEPLEGVPQLILDGAGWAPWPVLTGMEERNHLPSPGFEPLTVKSVTDRYPGF